MSLSDFEIGKIAEIVAGQSGTKLDAKALRQVIDRVVDQLNQQRGNPEVEGATCDTPAANENEQVTKRQEVASPPDLPPKAGSKTDPPYEEAPSSHSREGGSPSSPVGGPPRHSGPVGSQLPPPDEALVEAQGGLYQQIEKSDKTRVIIAAFGKDRPGVGAALTSVLAESNCSIEDISQTLLQDFFSMIMIVNIEGSTVDFSGLRERLQETETQLGMKVYVMHEDIFRYMHRI
ncbi:MAG: ACT domain-containing protein [candidate division Zixibacteria bacterium]|nr:ACT domain-containing protein [candidate division Zixibacteria bacterium]MDH3938643.1 ACT domain-containing protein [candidate division Zixibacteria bacterium]MDH4032410.1 ACT domain-containing protein [candidate division Zixibacteria bacterium]